MVQGKLYVTIKHNVLVQGVKVSRYVVMDPVTGWIAKGSKGYQGERSDLYKTRAEAQQVADQLNKKYKRT